MKRFTFFLLIALSACKYNDIPTNSCEVRDPANELPWLKARIREIESSSLRQYFRVEQVEYKGETGFYVSSCCPLCDIIPIFYKCSGEAVTGVDLSQLIPKGVVWQPSDFSCLMD